MDGGRLQGRAFTSRLAKVAGYHVGPKTNGIYGINLASAPSVREAAIFDKVTTFRGILKITLYSTYREVGNAFRVLTYTVDNSNSLTEECILSVHAGLDAVTGTSSQNATGLQQLASRVSVVSDGTNAMLQMLAESGADMPDSPYINFGLQVARSVGEAATAAIASGEINLATMLSDTYAPVQGSDPPVFTHPAQALLTRLARSHQENARQLPGFFETSFTDRNCFGAAAMPERSLP